MKNAIILHGRPSKKEYYSDKYPSASNSHWLSWLQKQLLINDIHAVTPEIPLAFEPVWEVWCKEVDRFEIGPQTVLVGHSTGGGFWLRWLSEHKEVRVGNVILVAPWIDVEKDSAPEFFDFKIDENLASRTKRLTIFHSIDDVAEIQSSVKELRKRLKNLKYREFHGYGHFTFHDMKTRKFPELFEECLK